jgi:hypothetical protein
MDVSFLSDLPWRQVLAPVLTLYGLALAWRGLRGGPNGQRGLLRRQAGALGRAEGWRLFVLGLALAGVGAGWFWEVRWLIFLSLGIGYVEVQEASWVINAWRWGEGRTATEPRASTSSPASGVAGHR